MGEVLVIGAARSGVAAARLLKEHGYQVTMTDSRCLEEKEALQKEGITVVDGGHPQWLFDKSWDFVVKKSPAFLIGSLLLNILLNKIYLYIQRLKLLIVLQKVSVTVR